MTILDQFPISGQVAPGFEPVRAVFAANFSKHGAVGAAVCVTLDGQPVVDLWGGAANAARTQPWTADTIVNVWSTSKGWLALAMHILAERGLLDFDAPVAAYWPEFAQNGKGGVLVRHLLTHTAGLPGPSDKVPDEAIYDWEAMVHAFEKSELFWEPGTKMGYHAASFGWLNGEILRRITGLTPGQFLRSQIAEPLRAAVAIGLTAAEQTRTAETLPPPALIRTIVRFLNSNSGRVVAAAFTNPPRNLAETNTRRWREAEIPSSNGHASARGLARVYTLLALGGEVGGLRLLSPGSVDHAGCEQIHAHDLVARSMVRRSLGFMLPEPELGDSRPLTAFGHPGMGGSLGFADPARRLAFGYVMNRMSFGLDPRADGLSRTVYSCLDGRAGEES